MKPLKLLSLFFSLLCLNSYSQYVTLEGRKFKDGEGNDFYPVVCNYLTMYLYSGQPPTVFFPTPNPENDAPCYDCDDFPSCLNQYSLNFNKIKELNFNAIRLFGLGPVLYNKDQEQMGWAFKAVDLEYAQTHGCDNYFHYFPVSPTLASDPNLNLAFEYIDSVLVRANNADLKVILLVGGALGEYVDTFPEEYSRYLSLLAQHIANVSPQAAKEALMAYDLFNEPTSSWYGLSLWPTITEGHSKHDVCEHVSNWYDSLKTHDPDHLVTFGGKPLLELFEFDAGVMKLDFYSPHVYVKKRTYEGANFFQGIIDQAHGIFYWMSENLPIPFLIGEIGFRSKYNYSSHPANEGTNEQQRDFADSTLRISKECLANGFSWWCFHDYYWSDLDCFHGVVAWDGATQSTEDKLVADAFQDFNPDDPVSNPTPPSNYYDPYHHEQYAPGTNIITGQIIDENGPVKDAWVCGITYLGKDTNNITKELYDTHYTFSNDTGSFELIPFDYYGVHDTSNCILDLKITTPSGQRLHYGWTTPPSDVDSGSTYYLLSTDWEFDAIVANCTISGSEYPVIQAFNSIGLKDVIFASGSQSDVKARTSVLFNPEVSSYRGSEIHCFCTPTFPDCNLLPAALLSNSSPQLESAPLNSTEEVELSFVLTTDSALVVLYPNPCKDVVTLEVTNPDNLQKLYTIEIYNSFGACVAIFQTSTARSVLPIESLSTGVYQVQIKSSEATFSKSLIKIK